MATSPIAMFGVLICSVLGAMGALFLKEGSAQISWNRFLNKKLATGVVCYGIAMVIGLLSLRFGDLSVLYPLNSTTYIWVTMLSKYRLKENINRLKVIGIFLIILGVSIIGISR